ncbi:hypothetical protein, partial [Lysobacter soli]|uniref:hypothetical protein n=1 Tax=Lysobacter soli TaxID=453783 RepID=UPI001C6EC942
HSSSFQRKLESILILSVRCDFEVEAAAQRCIATVGRRYRFVAPHPNPSPDGRGAQSDDVTLD